MNALEKALDRILAKAGYVKQANDSMVKRLPGHRGTMPVINLLNFKGRTVLVDTRDCGQYRFIQRIGKKVRRGEIVGCRFGGNGNEINFEWDDGEETTARFDHSHLLDWTHAKEGAYVFVLPTYLGIGEIEPKN